MGDRDLGPRFDADPTASSSRAMIQESFNGRYMVIYDSDNVSPDFAEREHELEACIERNELGGKVLIHKGAFPALGLSMIYAARGAAQRLVDACSPPIKTLTPDQRVYGIQDLRPKQDIF